MTFPVATGVGQKLAARVVVELKDKMTSAAAPSTTPGVESEEIVAALLALGYSQAEATGAVARAVAVGLPMLLLMRFLPFTRGAFPVLVWGGLRGGISIALALTLPDVGLRDLILSATYVVVVFSVVIQGATVGAAARRFVGDPEKLERPEG